MLELETIEVELFEDLYTALGSEERRTHGVVAEHIGSALCAVFPGLAPALVFSRVLGLGLREPTSENELDSVIAFMRSLRCAYAIPVGPQHRPAELAGWLEARGFSRGYPWMKFERGVEPYAATSELSIVQIGPEHAAAFADVVMQGFHLDERIRPWFEALPGRARWSCFVGFDGARALSSGTLFAHDGTGSLGFAATSAEARGRGGQNAMLAARIRRAAELGLEHLVVETGVRAPGKPDNSYRNILRAGFREAYVRDNWLAPRREE